LPWASRSRRRAPSCMPWSASSVPRRIQSPSPQALVMTLRDLTIFKETLKSQMEHVLHDRITNFVENDLNNLKMRGRFVPLKKGIQAQVMRERFLSLKKGIKAEVADEMREDSTPSAINTTPCAASHACSGAAALRHMAGIPPLLPFAAATSVASSSTLAGVAGTGSPSGVARKQLAEEMDSSVSAPVAHVTFEQPSVQLEETQRGLGEAERSRAAEFVQVRGDLLAVWEELVTVRGELLTARVEMVTIKGELDSLKGTLLKTKTDLAEQKECLQNMEREKLALEEEEKELGNKNSSDAVAAVPSPAPKHMLFDVEEELRMRQGA
ncbi:unnamed protein product, partial [Closterium sp. Naga37s-1]